jgi:hypothetical protein
MIVAKVIRSFMQRMQRLGGLTTVLQLWLQHLHSTFSWQMENNFIYGDIVNGFL